MFGGYLGIFFHSLVLGVNLRVAKLDVILLEQTCYVLYHYVKKQHMFLNLKINN